MNAEYSEFRFHSFWVESANQARRQVNVACSPEALPYAMHPAPDEHVRPRRLGALERMLHQLLSSERPSTTELIDFFEGLRRCLNIGLSLLETMEMVVDSTRSPMFRGLVATMHLRMKEGETLSQAMTRFPKAFDPFVVASVTAAEEAGNLPEALDQITFAMTQGNQLKKKLISGMVYPGIVVVMGMLVVVLLSFTLIPATAKNFAQFQSQVPWYSTAVAEAATIVRQFWWAAFPLFGLTFYFRSAIAQFYRSRWIQDWLIRTPIIGPVLRGLALSRVLRTLGTLLGCGVDVRTAFRLTAETAGQPDYSAYVSNIAHHVLNGDEYYEAFLRERHLIGNDGMRIANYMHIGAKTGDITNILETLAAVQEEDAFRKTEKLPKLLEPIVMAGLAGVIGVIMASVYLPTLLLAQEVIQSR